MEPQNKKFVDEVQDSKDGSGVHTPYLVFW